MFLSFWNAKRTWAVSLALGLCLAFLLTAVGAAREMRGFAGICAEVRQDTLRLHIVAASNAVSDQTLKLAVRDAVVKAAGALCKDAKNKAQAERILRANLETLAHIARQVTAQAYCPQPAVVRIENSWFSTSHYTADTLPAGEYTALRIVLGKGRGHNWWCCLYPSLCLAASGAHYARPAENALVTGKFEVRFAAVEWWEHKKAGHHRKKTN